MCQVDSSVGRSPVQETDDWISFVQTPVVLLSKNCSSWFVTVVRERSWWLLISIFLIHQCANFWHSSTPTVTRTSGPGYHRVMSYTTLYISTATLNLVCSVELATTEGWQGSRRWHGDVMKAKFEWCYCFSVAAE